MWYGLFFIPFVFLAFGAAVSLAPFADVVGPFGDEELLRFASLFIQAEKGRRRE